MKRIDRDKKWLDMAVKLAMAGDKVGGARIGAVLVINNRAVAMGQNINKSHPMQKRFARPGRPDSIYQHAEVNCVVNFLRNNSVDDLKRSTLYIGRVYGYNMESIGLAKPCKGCSHMINQMGIKRVVWTVDENELQNTS